jgi:Mg/Co/Ni transporter MgtE
MENQFNSKELQNITEKLSSPTAVNEERVKRADIINIVEKYCLQQTHRTFKTYEKGYSLAKKANNINLLKEIVSSVKNYIIDNIEDSEKRIAYKKLDLLFESLDSIIDLMGHDFEKQINHDLVYFLLGNLLKNIHE